MGVFGMVEGDFVCGWFKVIRCDGFVYVDKDYLIGNYIKFSVYYGVDYMMVEDFMLYLCGYII